MRSNTKREREVPLGPAEEWQQRYCPCGLHLFTFHVTLNSAISSLHSLESVQVENESLPETEESKVQRNEVTCPWFHRVSGGSSDSKSKVLFCCLPLQIRCQKNLGLKIH